MNDSSFLRKAVPLGVVAMLVGAGLLYAGPLTPPPGAIVGSGKTLVEVEPRVAISEVNTPGDAGSLFKITQPGSYYLTGNIQGVIDKHGVVIAASHVTLDLMGFELVGVPDPSWRDGVIVEAPGFVNVAVVNGSVRNWSNNGVNLFLISDGGCRIEGIRASNNDNINLNSGRGSVITKCVTTGGEFGVRAGEGSTVSDCTATASNSAGFSLSEGCTIRNCAAHNNVGNGVADAASSSTIASCAAYNNGGVGIAGGVGTTIVNCITKWNSLDGISVMRGCTVIGNTCNGNGRLGGSGAGIRVLVEDNRIEGNNCIGADRGIHVQGAGNIIIKNTCAGNVTDWDIVANNVVGPILDRRAPASAAINGFSAPSSLGTTDANANFSY